MSVPHITPQPRPIPTSNSDVPKSGGRIHGIYRALGRRFRQKRLRWLHSRFPDCQSILDIGGGPGFWELAEWRPKKLTLLNIHPSGQMVDGIEEIEGDATNIPFPDNSFDLAMSNSVIEHMYDQPRFARETMRVGRRIYCQTPSKYFPVEPHYLGVFIHWLPKRCLTPFVHRWLTLHGWITKPTAAEAVEFGADIHLLRKKDLQELFPGCAIETERFLGLPKSYVVWR